MSPSPQNAELLVVHGDEPHLVDRDVAAWRAAAAVEVEVIDAPPSLQPLIAALVEVPLFAGERALVVRNLAHLRPARRGPADPSEGEGGRGDAEALVRALGLRSPTTRVCFVVRGTVPAGSRLLAALRDCGATIVHHPAMRRAAVRQWLEGELRSRGLRLPAGGVDLLLQSSDGGLDAIAHELDKLAAHGPISGAGMQALVAGSETLQVYEVVERLAGPAPVRGAVLLGRLLDQGTAPQYLLAVLSGQIRDLLVAHALRLRGARGGAALAAATGKPPWMADRLLRQTQAIPSTLAVAWLRQLQRIDAGVKSGEVDDAAALRRWGITAAESLRPRPAVGARA
ncbi:MAG: DNA polymerase III subunit delta [Candidatus Dormibacteria bacterium]